MYRVEQIRGEAWEILGPSEATVFTGTLRQCEDWLDRQENLERTAARRAGWVQRLSGLFRCCFSQQRDSHSPGDPSSGMESTPAVSATRPTRAETSGPDSQT